MRLDETYIKAKGQSKYLYRAVDSDGDTFDYLLTARRDQKAAKRFFKKAVRTNGDPEKVTIDKSGLIKRGFVREWETAKQAFETGPNAILLSDLSIQNGEISNLAEFPILQMLCRQGLMIPGHYQNKDQKPLVIGSPENNQ